MRYLHNTGLYELSGEDYRGCFRMLPHFTDDVMDPFTELVRFGVGPRLSGEELRAAALDLMRHYYAPRPERNPFAAWGEQLAEDLPRLLEGDAADYHAYAFVTVRMVGSSFELLADHVDWCLGDDGAPVAASLREIVEATKVLSFRLARRRAVRSRSRRWARWPGRGSRPCPIWAASSNPHGSRRRLGGRPPRLRAAARRRRTSTARGA